MKHLLYLSYLLRHKWFVLLACWRRGLYWRGIVHDWSKFLPDEWFPYANYFYGQNSKTRKQTPQEQEAFDRAWLKHQHRSPHHWQHWVLREDSGEMKLLEMPIRDIKEMMADWEGAGRAITGMKNWSIWYRMVAHKMLLHESTRKWVEFCATIADAAERIEP